jgi:hypothetical protein
MASWCIVYLACPKDRRIGKTFGHHRKFDILKASIETTKRVFPTTDIFVFHEDFTEEEFNQLPPVKEYIQVDFSGHDDVFVEHVFPKGYVLMCRFFSGILQRLPQLQNYTHYMRLDDDSYFQPPWITEKHVRALLDQDYVYRSTFIDLKEHQGLFDYTIQFLRDKGYGNHIPSLLHWLSSRYVVSGDRYTGLAPYNNFHLASLRLWNHPLVTDYIDRLESDQCILKYGWLDANIHAMIIWLLAPFIGMNIHHDGSFGYRHNKHISHLNSTAIQWVDSLPFYPS